MIPVRLPSPQKTSKYRAKAQKTEGGHFASMAELRRWNDLRLLERAGKITDLRRQVRIPLAVNGLLICTYVADFTYHDFWKGDIVEDSKGVETPAFKIKAKLFRALMGKDILVTGAAARRKRKAA